MKAHMQDGIDDADGQRERAMEVRALWTLEQRIHARECAAMALITDRDDASKGVCNAIRVLNLFSVAGDG